MPDRLRRALRAVVAGKADWPLYVFGATGTGKTRGVLCLVDRVPGSRWFDMRTLLDDVYNTDAHTWRSLREPGLVVIDEVGTRGDDRFGREYDALLFAGSLREDKPTIWISNLSAERLKDQHDDRIWSRLCSGTKVPVDGDDRRFTAGPDQ